MFKIILQLVFPILIVSCSSIGQQFNAYAGDGVLIDNGPLAATDRYVLDLGRITLSKVSSYTFNIENLPTASSGPGKNYVIGIQIETLPDNIDILKNAEINPLLSVELMDKKGDLLIEVKSSLNEWTWIVDTKSWAKLAGKATAFIYENGINPTMFSPAQNEKYLLNISIIQPYSSEFEYSARLLAKTSGWK